MIKRMSGVMVFPRSDNCAYNLKIKRTSLKMQETTLKIKLKR